MLSHSPSRVDPLIPPLSLEPFRLIYVSVRGTPLGSYLVWAYPLELPHHYHAWKWLSLLLIKDQLLMVPRFFSHLLFRL